MNIMNCTEYLSDKELIGTLFSTEVDVDYKHKVPNTKPTTRLAGSSAPPPDIIIKTKNLGQSLITLKKLLTENKVRDK